MAHARSTALLFITLLQLCRTDLSGTWYSANVINEGDFSPKPISEIFSTQSPPFSSTNPIVVLPPSSTVAPPPFSTSFPPTLSTFSSSLSTLSSEGFTTPPSATLQSSTLPTFAPTYLERRPPVLELQPLSIPLSQDKSQPGGPPNYFLIYQQAPLVQNQAQSTFSTFPPTAFDVSTPQVTLSTPGLTQSPPTFSTVQADVSTPQTTIFQPGTSTPPTTFTTPGTVSTPSSFGTFRPSPSTTPSAVSFISSTSAMPSSTLSSAFRTSQTVPCTNNTAPPRYPALRIRMVAPSGSITNVNINPRQPATTTRRPAKTRSTTTRKPRTKKSGRNTFDGCVRMCNGKKPICATPLALSPIDPDRLKGFPSICHMACHNSFKTEQYEMLVDGRCGRLRTRIRPVDANKLKRDELNKATYTIVGNKPETIVEFASLPRH